MVLKIPPRHTVLRADDEGVRAEERRQLRGERSETVSLDAKEDRIRLPDRRQVAGRVNLHLEIAVGSDDSQTALLHRLEMRTAGEQDNVSPCLRQTRADIAANRAGADDRDFHEAFCAYTFATTPRWIFPVAVRGMVS